MFNRLVVYWVYGGVLAGVLLLTLAPILTAHWPMVLVATFLHLPAYMIHQFEEHDQDRFRLFFNQTIGKGHDVLSPMAVFITNVPGVWGVIALSLYAATLIHIGWALIAVYLVLVNAFVHIIHALIFRRYNPGLGTALVIFLPLGFITLGLIHEAQAAQWTHHVVGMVSAIMIHAAILIHVHRKLTALRA
jgi:Protein of unknown function with HXXEE motif